MDWKCLFLCLLQDSHCPREQQCFWSSPPGCLWSVRSTLHLFLPSFWGISAWSACQHTLSTLHCSSPTWNEGEQLKQWRKRLGRRCYLWNSTPSFFACLPKAIQDLKSKFSPTVFLWRLHLLGLFSKKGVDTEDLRRFTSRFSEHNLDKAVIFVCYCAFVMLITHFLILPLVIVIPWSHQKSWKWIYSKLQLGKVTPCSYTILSVDGAKCLLLYQFDSNIQMCKHTYTFTSIQNVQYLHYMYDWK